MIIRRNDYSTIDVPALGAWEPTRKVSVVLPAYESQRKLDLVLASLAEQTYPGHLTEVVVVDDNSPTPITLPEDRPADTRIVRPEAGRWGIPDAVRVGIEASTGQIVLRLDSDVVVNREHVEAHARWHHQVDYLAVTGEITFVADFDFDALSPAGVREAAAEDDFLGLFKGGALTECWTAAHIAKYDGLREMDDRAYTIANGASVSFCRSIYDEAGGMDVTIPLGEDSEFAFRLGQAGAAFVPDSAAEGWHLGNSAMQHRADEGRRFRSPYFRNRVPVLREHRRLSGVIPAVPMVEVVIDVTEAAYESVTTIVNDLFTGSMRDLRVLLLGPWSELGDERVGLLDDPQLDLRLIREYCSSDPRVRLVEQLDPTAAPTPYRLTLPPAVVIAPGTVDGLVKLIDQKRAGAALFVFEDADLAHQVRIERTAAVARALKTGGSGQDPLRHLDAVWGVWWDSGDSWFGTEAESAELDGSQLKRELDRLKERHEKEVRRADRWKETAEKAQRSTSHWKKNAEAARLRSERWEASALKWQTSALHWEQRFRGQTVRGLIRKAIEKLRR